MRAENTGQWFLDSSEFQGWVDGTGPPCLVCTGIRFFPPFRIANTTSSGVRQVSSDVITFRCYDLTDM